MGQALCRTSPKCSRGETARSSLPRLGPGAWEAALVHTLAPGDRVLPLNNGHFSTLFAEAARNLGIEVDEVPAHGAGRPAEMVEEEAAGGCRRAPPPTKAVLVVHTEDRRKNKKKITKTV